MKSEIKIGKQLARQRESRRHGKTQAEVAAALGISRGHLVTLENDRKQPSYDLLVRMADYYGVSLDALFERQPLPPSEAEQRALAYLQAMPERTRSQFLALGRALLDEEAQWEATQRETTQWQSYGFGLDAVEALLGPEFVARLQQRLATLTAQLGSPGAAIAALRATLLAEEAAEDGGE